MTNNLHAIFLNFRQGVVYEDLYEDFDLSENELISILQKNIKGNYDYKRILNGGIESQKQFIAHLNTRWNPLEPEKISEVEPPYLPKKENVCESSEFGK